MFPCDMKLPEPLQKQVEAEILLWIYMIHNKCETRQDARRLMIQRIKCRE